MGFYDQSIPLSDSVHFLRSLACTFAKALSKSPEIEFLREKTIVEPEPEAIGQILYNAPYMNGAEHLNYEWIENIRSRLNAAFSTEIKAYSGNAADFLTSLSTEIHPIGRADMQPPGISMKRLARMFLYSELPFLDSP